MFKHVKDCCNYICKNPDDSWLLTKMLAGTVVLALLGCIYYGMLALFEKITGKDLLNRGPKQSVSTKETKENN